MFYTWINKKTYFIHEGKKKTVKETSKRIEIKCSLNLILKLKIKKLLL